MAAALSVCPLCGYHFPMGAYYRLSSVLDPGSFRELDEKLTAGDPLRFPGYGAKLDGARRKTGMNEAVVTATGTVGGSRCVVGVLDSRFLMGSMSAAVGEKLTLAIEYAGKNKLPLILFCRQRRRADAGGHFVPHADGENQRGSGPVLGKGTAVHLRSHGPHHRRRHRQLCLVWVTSFWPSPVRSSASPGPGSFSRPSARPCRRAFSARSFRWSTALWTRWSPGSELREHPRPAAEAPRERRTAMAEKTAAERVALARHPQRPNITDYIDGLFTDFFEQRGDRACREDPAILGGIALFHGRPVTVIGHPEGQNAGGKPPVQLRDAGAGGLPQGSAAHEAGGEVPPPYIYLYRHRRGLPRPGGRGARVRARPSPGICFEMSRLTVPVIAVVTGEGNSGGALALAVADRVLMLENAVYAILSPEGFASILWKDASALRRGGGADEAHRPGADKAGGHRRASSRSRRAAPSRPQPVAVGIWTGP